MRPKGREIVGWDCFEGEYEIFCWFVEGEREGCVWQLEERRGVRAQHVSV